VKGSWLMVHGPWPVGLEGLYERGSFSSSMRFIWLSEFKEGSMVPGRWPSVISEVFHRLYEDEALCALVCNFEITHKTLPAS
jgi:hypothetical protein